MRAIVIIVFSRVCVMWVSWKSSNKRSSKETKAWEASGDGGATM